MKKIINKPIFSSKYHLPLSPPQKKKKKKLNMVIPFSIQLQDLLFYVAVQISLLSVPEIEEERKMSCPPTIDGRLSTDRQMLVFIMVWSPMHTRKLIISLQT